MRIIYHKTMKCIKENLWYTWHCKLRNTLIVNSITLATMTVIMHGGCYVVMATQVDGVQNFVIA